MTRQWLVEEKYLLACYLRFANVSRSRCEEQADNYMENSQCYDNIKLIGFGECEY